MQSLRNCLQATRSGFSLVEVLISLFLCTVIMAMVFVSLTTQNTLEIFNQGAVNLQQQARQAIDGMSREIRQSRLADIHITNGGAQINFSIGGDDISYYLNSGNQLVREYPAGTIQIIANQISSLNFALSGNVVNIEVTASNITQSRALNFSLAEQIFLRN